MKIRVLIADDEEAARHGVRRALQSLNCELSEAATGKQALEIIRGDRVDLVFLDLQMPGMTGHAVLEAVESMRSRPEIIVVTADDDLQSAVNCMRLGAEDYVTKPFEVERLRTIVRVHQKRLQLEDRVEDLERQLESGSAFGSLLGQSAGMREMFGRIERTAKAPLNVLITGETGTGKELIASELHQRSPRASGPFVAINAAALPEGLAESELFGHTKGAFTGADKASDGAFVRADGGTLFLDEVGDMPLALQAKMLRVLQEGVVTPLGADRGRTVDVRIVSATHQDLEAAQENGRFRADLFYRLRGVQLDVPPLRAREGDLLLLAEHFLRAIARDLDLGERRLGRAASARLLAHSWPGNVRELAQTVQAAAALATGTEILPTDLDLGPSRAAEQDARNWDGFLDLPLTEAKQALVARFEREAVVRALHECAGNVSQAARQLGIHRQSLQQKMTALGIDRDERGGGASR